MQPPYRTRIEDVPLEQNLREDEGWIDMQVQFLIDGRAANATGSSSAAPCCRRAPATSATSIRTATSSSS